MELLAGGTLGRYRLLERAGAGGMAEVWRAVQPSLDRVVAIKVLPRHLAGEPGYIERFRREARAVSRLDHPNILGIHDFGEDDGFTYMVMPFISGGTLERNLGQPWSVPAAVRVLEPLAAALDYAHAHGIIHRDVKPANVLIGEGGRIVLADFGIARMTEGTLAVSVTDSHIGTVAYVSPEQVQGTPAAPASDQYSLGVMAYEMLTSRRPFEAELPMAIALAHVDRTLPAPRTINPAITVEVERVLVKALAKHPEDRYASVSAFVAALSKADWRPTYPIPARNVAGALRDRSPPFAPVSDSPPSVKPTLKKPERDTSVRPVSRASTRLGPLMTLMAGLGMLGFVGGTLLGWRLFSGGPSSRATPPPTVVAATASTPTAAIVALPATPVPPTVATTVVPTAPPAAGGATQQPPTPTRILTTATPIPPTRIAQQPTAAVMRPGGTGIASITDVGIESVGPQYPVETPTASPVATQPGSVADVFITDVSDIGIGAIGPQYPVETPIGPTVTTAITPTPPTAGPKPAGIDMRRWQTYENRRYRFSIRYPETWPRSAESTNGDGASLNVGEPDADIRVSASLILPGTSPFKPDIAPSYQQRTVTMDNGEEGTLIVGRKGDRIVYAMFLGRLAVAYTFYAETTEGFYRENQEILLRVAKSLSLTPG